MRFQSLLRINYPIYRYCTNARIVINLTRHTFTRTRRIEFFLTFMYMRIGGSGEGETGKAWQRSSIANRQRAWIHGHLEKCPNFHFLPVRVSFLRSVSLHLVFPFREGVITRLTGWLARLLSTQFHWEHYRIDVAREQGRNSRLVSNNGLILEKDYK